MSDDNARTRVLYVGGMPRSGSTLLTWILGQLPGHCALGEVYYVWSAGVERDQTCGCGVPFSRCEFWTAVGDEAFGGWGSVDLDRVKALKSRVDKTSRIPHVLLARRMPSFRRDRDEYAALMTRLYTAAARVAGSPILVDGSKRPSLAYILRMSPDIDLRMVQLVRAPHGVVHSWSKQIALPAGIGANDYLKVRPTRVITRRWVTVNATVRAVRHLGVPLITIRYEDLVADPHGVLDRIARFCDIEPGEASAFVQPDGVHLPPAHMVAGGRMRFTPSPLTLRLDETWRSEMPVGKRRVVSGATALARRRYGYSR
ncbi:MAG: sulfotransferase family protein [Nocardioidaceae bacterium]